MLRKASNIALATIIAAVIGGVFSYLASRQILRVEVTLPDSSQESLSVRAASNKIEGLSRQLTIAEAEIATLEKRLAQGTSSEQKEQSLLGRIKTLEDDLAERDRTIASLSQERDRSAGREIRHSSADPIQPENQPDSLFRTRWFQVKVVSIEADPGEITLLAEFNTVKNEAVEFHLRANDTFVLDHQGNRWGGYLRVKDTLGVFSSPSVELLPGTTVRSRIRFEANGQGSPSLPDPQPPFTLIAEEIHSQQRIVIQGLNSR